MPKIANTALATSLPALDICKGFALFPGLGAARAGININTATSKLIDIKTPILTWRITLGVDLSLMAGVCGPSYGTIMRYSDIEYDATKLTMALDSDQTDAGLIFGLGLAINYTFQLETITVRWISDGWNSRLESNWQLTDNTSFRINFDLLAMLLEFILGKLGKVGQKITQVQNVFQAIGGSFAIYGSESDVIASGRGKYTVSPQLDLPINIIGLLKKFAAVDAVVTALEKINIFISVGPIFSLVIPIDFQITGYAVDSGRYQSLTWTDDGVTATYSSGTVSGEAKQLSVDIRHVAAQRFGLKVGIFFDFNFLKVLSVNKQVTYDMPDLLKFGIKFDPVTNTLSNKAGGQTVPLAAMTSALDENEYEVVFASCGHASS
ncbi:MAG: hypothetical protein ACRERC_25320 [Candidatus Binatia bacterium]